MAALSSPSPKAYHGQVTVTGATGVPTLIIDLAGAAGAHETGWTVVITNNDADTGDDLFIGFAATDDPLTAGTPVYNGTDNPANRRIVLEGLPPATKIYANCTNGETRDVRYLAYPVFN